MKDADSVTGTSSSLDRILNAEKMETAYIALQGPSNNAEKSDVKSLIVLWFLQINY